MATTLVVAVLVGGCAMGSSTSSRSGSPARPRVVVAENFWGSIVTQLAGNKADVANIISSPDIDPHDYEATAADSRAVASADYVVYNGIGYDAWAKKALDANPNRARKVLEVGKLLGKNEGDNPHQWYSPDSVTRVIEQVTADLESIDPADAPYFDQQKNSYTTTGLAQYRSLIQQIHTKYANAPVGASESIFTPLADALGLKILTPESFLAAIAEGTDPTAGDKTTVDAQIKDKQIKVFVFNSQNSTPDVQRLVNDARAAHIPVTTVTETLSPANVTFQDWQSKQLQALASALAHAGSS
jgi:zinc/manganese transport system substrate-binding protein